MRKRMMIGKEVLNREHLASLMKSRNLSQGRLAIRAGLFQAHISMMLTGKIQSPTYETLKALAKALKTSIENLTRSEKNEQGKAGEKNPAV